MESPKLLASNITRRSSDHTPMLAWHPLTFLSPERLTELSSWHGHIPFAFWCVAELQPKMIVELGTHKGDSYSAFCQAVNHVSLSSQCFAVDTWKGDEHSGRYGPEVYEELAAYHNPRYRHFSVLIKSTFDDAAARFVDECIDLLHVDGCHTYDAVKHDFETWRPKLSTDALVLFHDTAVHEKDFGVWRFWAEISREHTSFEFHHAFGLGVLAIGGKAEELVKCLQVNAASARYAFSRLGETVINTGLLQRTSVERDGLVLRLDQAERGRGQSDGQLRSANTELDQFRQDTSALRQTLALRENELKSIGHELANLNARLAEREDEIARLGADSTALRQSLAENENQLERTKDEAAASRRMLEQRDEELGYLRAASTGREDELSSVLAEAKVLRQTLTERTHALGRLGAELLNLRQSVSWRLTAPLRELLRLGDRLRRSLWPRRHRFQLHPVAQIASIDASQGLWHAQGADPQFLLISGSRHQPTRWCALTMRMNHSAAGQSPVLRVDLGGGFSDDRAIALPSARDGTLRAIIELPRFTQALRLDLCRGPGLVEIKDVTIQEISSEKGKKLKRRLDMELAAVVQPSVNDGTRGLVALSARDRQPPANRDEYSLDVTAFVRDRLKAEFDALPITASKKPKIVFASHEATRTGAPLILLNLVQHFARTGQYELFLFCDAPGPLLDAFGEHARVIKGWTHKWSESSSTTDDLTEVFGRERPILAICNTAIVPHYSEAFRRFGIPVVTLVHELADRVSESYLRWIYGTSDRIVFPAEFVRKAANTKVILPKDKAVVIPQGLLDPGIANGDRVSADSIVCQRLGVPAESFLVLGCGTVDLRKGTDLFVNLAHTVLGKTDALVHFVWVGAEYDENLLPFFARKDLANFGIADRVHFVGPQDAPAVFFQASDVFVLTSREDPFPCVVLEAMAAGTPVIAFSEAGGAPEALAEGCGIVVGYRDIDAMADAVLDLYHNPEKAAQLSASARKRVLEKYRFEDYYRALVTLAQDQLGVSFERIAEEEASRAPSGSSQYERSQEKRDLQLIKNDGGFDPNFFLSPFLPHLCGDAAIESFLRGWAEGTLERKPCSGFNPYIYAAEALTETEVGIRNPFAHFIEKGKPQGRWLTPLIRPPFDAPGSTRLRMALQVHAYYPDLFDALLGSLASNGSNCDLFVSTVGKKELEWVQKRLQAYDKGEVHISIVPNRGRDLRPFLTEYNFLDGTYDLVGHVHCKKSLHFGTQLGELWRQFLWRSLLGPEHPMMDVIARSFETDPTLGLVFPDDPNLVGWWRNKQLATHLARRMRLNIELPDAFEFPVGSMFWCRPAALRPLFELGLSWDDYPPEPLPIDGTMLHAIERLLPFTVEHEGYRCVATHIPGLTR